MKVTLFAVLMLSLGLGMPLAAHAADAEAPAKKADPKKPDKKPVGKGAAEKDSGTKDAYKLRGSLQ